MGLGQTIISVCNDGNVSQLDVTDKVLGGPYFRIEVYRCSQPSGGYGVTASGSRVEFICGEDHLSPESNRLFRYTFSLGDETDNLTHLPSVLEGREEFNPTGTPNGSWEVRIRDLDPLSDSYGAVLRATAEPADGGYKLSYELMNPPELERVQIVSPLSQPIAKLNRGLPDLGSELSLLGTPVKLDGDGLVEISVGSEHNLTVSKPSALSDLDEKFKSIVETLRHPKFSRFVANIDAYEAFGDFGAKPTHPGTNLIGPNAKLAAESIFVRQYRAALVLLGRLVSPEMALGASKPLSLADWKTNTRPGVYAIFVGAAVNHIAIYKLGLDKVHSDYGGIPMKLAPGSRLEDGANPVADAWRCNRSLGEIADVLYLSEPHDQY